MRQAVAYVENATARRAKLAGRRVAYFVALTVTAVLIGIASIACALAALWIALLPYCGPAGAPLVISGILLAGFVGVLGLLRHSQRPDDTPPISVAVPNPPTGGQTIPLLIGAVLAGFSLGVTRK